MGALFVSVRMAGCSPTWIIIGLFCQSNLEPDSQNIGKELARRPRNLCGQLGVGSRFYLKRAHLATQLALLGPSDILPFAHEDGGRNHWYVFDSQDLY